MNTDPKTPLLSPPSSLTRKNEGRTQKGVLIFIVSIVFLMSLAALVISLHSHNIQPLLSIIERPLTIEIDLRSLPDSSSLPSQPRGIAEGVSAKSNPYLWQIGSYNWTNAMLSWQRTAFHFQPQKNWMNGNSTPKLYLFALITSPSTI